MKKIILSAAFAVFCSIGAKAQQSSFKRLFPNDEKPKVKEATKSSTAPKDVSKPAKQRIFENYTAPGATSSINRSAKASTQKIEIASEKPIVKEETKASVEEKKFPPTQGEEKKSN
jgi:hydrogenase maturation factor